jgi:hypothetical protein
MLCGFCPQNDAQHGFAPGFAPGFGGVIVLSFPCIMHCSAFRALRSSAYLKKIPSNLPAAIGFSN